MRCGQHAGNQSTLAIQLCDAARLWDTKWAAGGNGGDEDSNGGQCAGYCHCKCWFDPLSADRKKTETRNMRFKVPSAKAFMYACPGCLLEKGMMDAGPLQNRGQTVRIGERTVRIVRGDSHCFWRAAVFGAALQNEDEELSYNDEASRAVALRFWTAEQLRLRQNETLPSTWTLKHTALAESGGDYAAYRRGIMSKAYGGALEAHLIVDHEHVSRPVRLLHERHGHLHIVDTFLPRNAALQQLCPIDLVWRYAGGCAYGQHYDLALSMTPSAEAAAVSAAEAAAQAARSSGQGAGRGRSHTSARGRASARGHGRRERGRGRGRSRSQSQSRGRSPGRGRGAKHGKGRQKKKRKLKILGLTPNESGQLGRLLTSSTVKVKYPEISLTLEASDFQRLRTPRRRSERTTRFHLNDELVNAFAYLLQSHHTDCLAMSTFFWTKLTENGCFNYSNVKRWHRATNIFKSGLVLFPIHLPQHWALVAFAPSQDALYYVDSMEANGDGDDNAAARRGQQEQVCSMISQYLECEATRLREVSAKGYVPPSGAEFSVADAADLCEGQRPPQQENSWDCGVFMLAAMYQLAGGAALRWQQGGMATLRGRIALSLKAKALEFE